jgi:hypothetical protein
VSLRRVLEPKRPRNLKATLAAGGLMLGAFVLGSWWAPFSPKRGLGLAFGIGAALVFVFEMLYPARRPRAWPLGTAQAWVQAHVYLGLLALVAVLLHAGLRWPHGAMGWALLLLSAWVTLTGLAGVWLQKWIPAALAEGLRIEALFERIPGLLADLVSEADALMQDASDTLEGFYRRDVRPALETLRPSWAFLLDVRAGRERALEPFRRIAPFVEAEEKPKVDDLMGLLADKMELDAQYSLQRLLRRWLLLHVPPAGLLMALLLVHVGAWLWY